MSNTNTGKKKVAVISTSLLFSLGMGIFMMYIFGFSIKSSSQYACTLEQARRSREVTWQLGEPIEPGFFAWLSYHESQGSISQGSFSTSVSGPRGNGRIRAEYYRAPVHSYLYVQFKGSEGWVDVYRGDYPCR
jgi:hypothetical protein